jgi:hypothetical protein
LIRSRNATLHSTRSTARSVQFDLIFKYRIKVAGELIGDARAPHASSEAFSSDGIENLGKQRLPKSGKHRVNGNGEEILLNK